LEEVDLMFKIKYHSDPKMSYKEAALKAKEQTEMLRLDQNDLKKGGAEHIEKTN
jgi:hypothetical protein